MHPITHQFQNLHSRCNRWRTIPPIRSKNLNWATSPPKLRLSQHLAALFVPSKVSQDACWEKSTSASSTEHKDVEVVDFLPGLSPKNYFRFSLRKISSFYQTKMERNYFLLVQSAVPPGFPVNYQTQHIFFPFFYFSGKTSNNKKIPETYIFKKPAPKCQWSVTYSLKKFLQVKA